MKTLGWYRAAASIVANAFIVAKRQQQPMCQLPIRDLPGEDETLQWAPVPKTKVEILT